MRGEYFIGRTEAVFLLGLEIRNRERFKILSCHRHFHYGDVMIIMLYVSSTNSTISYRLKAFPYMLYFVSYCTESSMGKITSQSVCVQ